MTEHVASVEIFCKKKKKIQNKGCIRVVASSGELVLRLKIPSSSVTLLENLLEKLCL